MPTKTKRDEEKWQKAIEIAKEQGQAKNWAYIMGIYKKMDPDYEFKSGPEAKQALRSDIIHLAAGLPKGNRFRRALLRTLQRPHKIARTPVVVMEALRPVFTEDPNDLDTFADEVDYHIKKSLLAAMDKILTLKSFKPIAYGPKDEEQASWNGGYHREMHYWAKVEYPTSITLRGKFKMNLVKRWEEALAAHRAETNGQVPALTREVVEHYADFLLEEYHPAEYLGEEAQDIVWEALSNPYKGIDTEAQMSEENAEGETEEHVESPSVDFRLRFEVDTDKAKLDIDRQPDALGLTFTTPVNIRLRKIVSPWDSDYGER